MLNCKDAAYTLRIDTVTPEVIELKKLSGMIQWKSLGYRG